MHWLFLTDFCVYQQIYSAISHRIMCCCCTHCERFSLAATCNKTEALRLDGHSSALDVFLHIPYKKNNNIKAKQIDHHKRKETKRKVWTWHFYNITSEITGQLYVCNSGADRLPIDEGTFPSWVVAHQHHCNFLPGWQQCHANRFSHLYQPCKKI